MEAAMLGNHCADVMEYRLKQQRIRENNKYKNSVGDVFNRKKYKVKHQHYRTKTKWEQKR